MRARFGRLLEKYGQTVYFCPGGTAEKIPAKAFIQAMNEGRGEWRQKLPSPLGLVPQDRFLYLGSPEVPLDGSGGGTILWQGKKLKVLAAQAVWVGDAISHWWATLGLEDREKD